MGIYQLQNEFGGLKERQSRQKRKLQRQGEGTTKSQLRQKPR